MRTLTRKLFRELWETRAQSLAICLVIGSGVAVLVMSLNTLGLLRETRDAYYDRYRFAHVFASVTRAPQPVESQLLSIDDVAAVETRIVSEVTLDVESLEEPAVGRLISLPTDPKSGLNQIHLRRGRFPEPDRAGEVIASEPFFESNQLRLGDRVDAVLNGRSQPLVVVGVALSPEYVIQVRAGELLPNDRRFGVLWMPRRQMEAAFDMEGAFNDVSVRLLRGANEAEVIDRMDLILQRYGAVGAYGRDQHISARFVADELKQLRATGMVAPTIFMAVAAFLLNVVLARRISTHRTIIAALKAFGYTNTEIAWHYMQSSLIVAGIGAVGGVIAGQRMADGLSSVYAEFYRFPTMVYQPDWRVNVIAMAVSLLAAVIGSWREVQSAAKLPPAEAMQPAAPAVYRRTWLERLGMMRWIPVTTRMILRGLRRRPISAALSSLGIAFSVSVMVLSGFGSDAMEHLIQFQFTTAQRQDVQVTFNNVATPAVRHDLRHLPGVHAVEPFRAVAVNLVSEHRQYRTNILGLGQERDLFRLLNTESKPIRLPPSGIVLNDKLAKILNVAPGEELEFEVLEGERPVGRILVSGLATEYAGTSAYMDRAALNQLMRETDTVSGAYLAVDSLHQPALYQQLKRTPEVASVQIQASAIETFRETIVKNQLTMQSFTLFFACVIAIGVVYNTARVALDERSRELATLRVIGFTRLEVSTILLGELAILTAAAIPVGWAIGYGFCAAMVVGFESELYRIPLMIRPESYARAALVTTVAATISGILVRRRLDHLDLVDVLKSRE
ncbi:MAG: FtsX-like permease family protein [Planctomycetota bacterium]